MKRSLAALLKRITVYLLVAAVLFLGGLAIYAVKSQSQEVRYTVYNTRPSGARALFLLAQSMGYRVEGFERPARFLPADAVMVAFEPELPLMDARLETSYLKKWVEAGGVAIIIGELSNLQDYGLIGGIPTPPAVPGFEDYIVYDMGRGRVIFANNSNEYTNEGLKAIQPGVRFIKLLDSIGKKRLLFNEYFHGVHSGTPLFFEITGQLGVLVLIQLGLALAALVLAKTLRFGKPVIVFENIKRRENENLYALSNIYSRARACNQVIEACIEDFKAELGLYLGLGTGAGTEDIIREAAGDRLLMRFDIKRLFTACGEYVHSGRHDSKGMLMLLNRMDKIRREIKI